MAVNLRTDALHGFFQPLLFQKVKLMPAGSPGKLGGGIFYEDAFGVNVDLFEQRYKLHTVAHAKVLVHGGGRIRNPQRIILGRRISACGPRVGCFFRQPDGQLRDVYGVNQRIGQICID